MVREVLIWPHPVLKKKATPVTRVDDSVRTLVKDMFETMYAEDGVGLAAPQIGILKRVIVLDTRPQQPDSNPLPMINPEIIATSGDLVYSEGCLSIPGKQRKNNRVIGGARRWSRVGSPSCVGRPGCTSSRSVRRSSRDSSSRSRSTCR